MQTKNELTPVQVETLTLIRDYRKKNGYSPTFAEMAEAAQVNGNAISDRVTSMIKKGAITKTPGIARSICPVLFGQLTRDESCRQIHGTLLLQPLLNHRRRASSPEMYAVPSQAEVHELSMLWIPASRCHPLARLR